MTNGGYTPVTVFRVTGTRTWAFPKLSFTAIWFVFGFEGYRPVKLMIAYDPDPVIVRPWNRPGAVAGEDRKFRVAEDAV
jgi:hypothetical protein